jgi:hypothetical protein
MDGKQKRKKSESGTVRSAAAPPGVNAGRGNPPVRQGLSPEWKWGGQQLGEAFAIAGFVGFLFVCMILPLVGKAGDQVAWTQKNFMAFALAVLATLGLTILSAGSKWEQMKAGRGAFPKLSLALTAVCIGLLVALFGGWLSI